MCFASYGCEYHRRAASEAEAALTWVTSSCQQAPLAMLSAGTPAYARQVLLLLLWPLFRAALRLCCSHCFHKLAAGCQHRVLRISYRQPACT